MKFEPVLPNEMEKNTATSHNYISNHFPEATLLCLHIVQKQEFWEIPRGNLTDLIRNNLRGGTLSLFSL